MKITLETEFRSATVIETNISSLEQNEADRACDLFKAAMLAVGFHPHTIAVCFNEDENSGTTPN